MLLGPVMKVAVPGFIAVIATMAWTTALMPRRGIFNQGVGRLCAAAGAVLVASDIAVGVSMFDPPEESLMVWLSLFIWVTYLGGWLLFLLAVAHPNPRRTQL